MKRKVRFLAVMTAITAVCSIVGSCGPNKPKEQGEKVDTTKTQLSVYSYDGGYGSDWLFKAKERYEALYKDKSFEDGKTGVQIMIDATKTGVTADSIKNDEYAVYFVEGGEDYHIWRNKNCFEDLTSVVTSASTYDNKTIESKLTPEQQAYWGVQEGGETHYYGLPHYEGYYGIVYNIDLFDAKGFYFAKDKTDGDFIIPGDNENKSDGPDGEHGTADDGLPATYEEFFALCDYIKEQSVIPLLWTGEVYSQYVTSLTHSLFADFEGKDQTMLNYTFNGTATDLGKIENGVFVKDGNETVITGANGYELARQQGKYEAIKFTETITKTDKYHNSEAFNSLTQIGAQERFLKASWQSGDGINDPCAMLVDGVWWENEAGATFKAMEQAWGEDATKMSRNFGWMYLPKANADKVGQKNVLCDVMYSKCFVKAGLNDVQKKLALDFVQFCNSDTSLAEFTTTTGAPKALQYTLSESDQAKLSPYSKSLFAYKQSADVVYAVSQNELYVNNASKLDRIKGLYNTQVSGNSYSTPVKGMHENSKLTAESYFSGIYDVFSALKIWKDFN